MKIEICKSIYDRLCEKGVCASKEYARKMAKPPRNANKLIWGVEYNNSWPDVSREKGGDMTWEQAYNHVLDLRDIYMVMNS